MPPFAPLVGATPQSPPFPRYNQFPLGASATGGLGEAAERPRRGKGGRARRNGSRARARDVSVRVGQYPIEEDQLRVPSA